MKKRYYLDTSIWLNLFKKETNPKGCIPYWKLAKDFIQKVEENSEKLIVSTIVLKEIYFSANEKFNIIKKFLDESDFIEIVKTSPEDYDLAREWERIDGKLSFYDYLHTAIAKRLNSDLITRDARLIEFAKSYIRVFKPEEIL